MSGPGVSDSPNAAFAALSARLSGAGANGLSSELSEIEQFVAARDDANLTAALDRRCRALEGMGLVKVDKVSLDSVPVYKTGMCVDKWADKLFIPILQIQGGAVLRQWCYEDNKMVNGLNPPPETMHIAVHRFTARDADSATLEAMLERGDISSFRIGAEHARTGMSIGDSVKLLVDLPTDIEGESRPTWIDKQSTIVKAEEARILVYSEADSKTERYARTHVQPKPHRGPKGFTTPQQGGVASSDWPTAEQVGPYLDRGVLDSMVE